MILTEEAIYDLCPHSYTDYFPILLAAIVFGLDWQRLFLPCLATRALTGFAAGRTEAKAARPAANQGGGLSEWGRKTQNKRITLYGVLYTLHTALSTQTVSFLEIIYVSVPSLKDFLIMKCCKRTEVKYSNPLLRIESPVLYRCGHFWQVT